MGMKSCWEGGAVSSWPVEWSAVAAQKLKVSIANSNECSFKLIRSRVSWSSLASHFMPDGCHPSVSLSTLPWCWAEAWWWPPHPPKHMSCIKSANSLGKVDYIPKVKLKGWEEIYALWEDFNYTPPKEGTNTGRHEELNQNFKLL